MSINDEVHDRHTFVMFYKHQAEDGNLLHSSTEEYSDVELSGQARWWRVK